MRKRYGRIINITSIAGQMGNPGQTNYSASKAGQIGFTKALAREVAGRKITVNAVAPGYVDTDINVNLPEEAREFIQKANPQRDVLVISHTDGRGEGVFPIIDMRRWDWCVCSESAALKTISVFMGVDLAPSRSHTPALAKHAEVMP